MGKSYPLIRIALAFYSVCAFGLANAADVPSDWPQWRGPTRDAITIGPRWPAKLERSALQPIWRTELGPSYSGPIVTRDRVFVTETKDKATEIARALDRSTGKQLWQVEWPGSMTVPFFAKANGDWIRATPTWDGEHLFVAGMRDVLVCLNGQDGKELWRVDFSSHFKVPIPAFGYVSSPLLDGDNLYTQAGAGVVKLNKKSGSILWRALADEGGMMGSAFSSPIVATIAGKKQLVVQTRSRLAGVDLDSGAILWAIPIPAQRGMNILTPTVWNGFIFTSAYGAKSYLFAVEKQGETFEVKTKWTLPAQANMSSPVILGDYAYLHLLNQRFTCIDLKNGTVRWTTDQKFGKYWSMVAQGDRILALDERGILYLIHASPDSFQLVSEAKISDAETWAHLAVCGSQLFIRELNAMAVYDWK